MSEITQTAAIRSNLLLLQQTQRMIDKTQTRLSTGKKINTALDGPQAFFAAKGLSTRAADLLGLKDAMGQAISTIKAADTAVSAIQGLIDQARGLTESALQNVGNDAQSVETRRQLANDFNQIVQAIDNLARDAGYGGRNLAIGDGTVIAADGTGRANINEIIGIDGTTVTNVGRPETYEVAVTGSGAISGSITDMANTENARGLANLQIYGTQNESGGSYDNITVRIDGGAGRDKTITVSDGTNTRAIQISADGSDNGTYVFNFSGQNEFNGVPLDADGKTVVVGDTNIFTGVIIEFTVDVDSIERVPQTSGVGVSRIEKYVDHQVSVTNSSGETITRDASRSVGSNRLSTGENAFAFQNGTVRVNVDPAQLQVSAASTQASVGAFFGPDAGVLGDYITRIDASNFTQNTQLNFELETTRAQAGQEVGTMVNIGTATLAEELSASYSTLPLNGPDRTYRYEATVVGAESGDLELASDSVGVDGAARGFAAGSVTVTGLDRDANFRIQSEITAAGELTFTLIDETTGSTLNFPAETATFAGAAGVQTITFEDTDAGVTVSFDIDLSSAAAEALQEIVPGSLGFETMELGDDTLLNLGFTANNIDAFNISAVLPTEPVEYTVEVASVGTAARIDFATATVAVGDVNWLELELVGSDGATHSLAFSMSGGPANFPDKAAYTQTALRNAIAGAGIEIDDEAIDLSQITVTATGGGDFTINFGTSGLSINDGGVAGSGLTVRDADGGAIQVGGAGDPDVYYRTTYSLNDGGDTSTAENVSYWLNTDSSAALTNAGAAHAGGATFTGATLDFVGAGGIQVGTTLQYGTTLTAGATATFTYVPEGYTGDVTFDFSARETTLSVTELDEDGNTVAGPITLQNADGTTSLFGSNSTVTATINGVQVTLIVADADALADGEQAEQVVTPPQSAMVNLTVNEVDADGNTIRTATLEGVTSAFRQADLTLIGSGVDPIETALSFDPALLVSAADAAAAMTSTSTIYNVFDIGDLNGVNTAGNAGELTFSINGQAVTVDLDGVVDSAGLTTAIQTAVTAAGVGSASNVTATLANNTITLSDSSGRELADVSLRTHTGAQYGANPLTENGREAGLNASVEISQGDAVEREIATRVIVGGTSNNDLFVTFNERRTSIIQVQAINLSTSGTGLRVDRAGNNWQDVADIERSVRALDDATTALRAASSSFATALNIVQARENFTEEFANVLREGSDKLILADQNEEGANMLALQTRQQLGTISLSIANQSQQAILQLF